jgi:hypothetical protein
MDYCYIPKDCKNDIKAGWYKLNIINHLLFIITLIKDKEKIKNINKKESIVILEENIIEIFPNAIKSNTKCDDVYYIETNERKKYTNYIKDMVQEKIIGEKINE